MTARRELSGFSLVELIVVVTVISVVMAVGIPSFAEWIANSRLRTAASSILNGLQLTRSEAIRSNARVQFQLTGLTGGWQVTREAVVNAEPQRCNFEGGAIVQSRPSPPSNASLVVSPFSDTTATTAKADNLFFVFGPNGWQGCADIQTKQFFALGLDTTAISEGNSRDLRIVLLRGGGARLCDPHASDTRACPD